MGLGLYQRSWGLDIEQSLKALADGNRLRIVQMIAKENAICARDLLKELDITQPTLSHHMKALVGCGLVKSTKKGRWCYYSIDGEHARELADFMGKLAELAALRESAQDEATR